MKWKSLSCVWLFATPWTVHGFLQARLLEWVDFPFSQGIFPTQGLNPGLLHCRQILYQLSHKGSPRILEWVACSFSSGSSRPRNPTGVSCVTGGFFTNWAIREALWNIILFPLNTQAIRALVSQACLPEIGPSHKVSSKFPSLPQGCCPGDAQDRADPHIFPPGPSAEPPRIASVVSHPQEADAKMFVLPLWLGVGAGVQESSLCLKHRPVLLIPHSRDQAASSHKTSPFVGCGPGNVGKYHPEYNNLYLGPAFPQGS